MTMPQIAYNPISNSTASRKRRLWTPLETGQSLDMLRNRLGKEAKL